ncbi:MAG: hypothetical protein MI923_23915 [Phycisphaerales bacterium]|nr:hypothetical protein [Phycisphaerales bacterium]
MTVCGLLSADISSPVPGRLLRSPVGWSIVLQPLRSQAFFWGDYSRRGEEMARATVGRVPPAVTAYEGLRAISDAACRRGPVNPSR